MLSFRGVRRALLVLAVGTLVRPASGDVATGATGVRVIERDVMRRVPAGPFIMGMDDEERIDAQEACRLEIGEELGSAVCDRRDGLVTAATGIPREVWLPAYEIDAYETTTRQYRECVAAGACDVAPLIKGDSRLVRDAWPVINVTWYDADAYCRWRGKRLPSEAEWEKAARGVDARRFPWGRDDADDRANRGRVDEESFRTMTANLELGVPDARDGHKLLAPPGSLRFGKSPYGVYDLAGNASEWVDDWWSDRYRSDGVLGQRGPANGSFRVVRGGSFVDPHIFSRTYYRSWAPPAMRAVDRGFRCARSIDD
jgi:formylglycine-generating enzyme